MRIVIDYQGAQSESRYRGIGRYTQALTHAIVRNAGNHEVIIMLNGLFPETISPIRDLFKDLLPQSSIQVWEAPGPVAEYHPANKWRRENAEKIRAAFLRRLKPDVVWITSLFEGFIDNAVTSAELSVDIPVIITIYDLIPLINPAYYLKANPSYKNFYMKKIAQLKRAYKCIAISKQAYREAHEILNINDEWVTELIGGVNTLFKPLKFSSQERQDLDQHLYQHYGINKKFILYTGGDDYRKNLPRLIKAYALLPKLLRDNHQLVFVGKFGTENSIKLKQLVQTNNLNDSEVIFPGYLDDDTLVKFYNLCEVVILPSLNEGLGLTLIEAMSCEKAILGSNVSIIPDIIGNSQALFNPLDIKSIRDKLAQTLSDDKFRASLIQHGLKQISQFSWDESAKRTIKLFEESNKNYKKSIDIKNKKNDHLKLAFVSPLPPEPTGIADYSAELIPALSEHYDLILIVAQNTVDPTWQQSGYQIRTPEWLNENFLEIDRIIYHFGNSRFHAYMLPLIKKFPGVIVLHDFFLSGLYSNLELTNIVPGIWTNALYYTHGYRLVKERFTKDNVAMIDSYPANLQVLQYATGIIVHSQYSKKIAEQWYGNHFINKFKIIPLLRASLPGYSRDEARRSLGISPSQHLVCSFGMVSPTKLHHRLLSSWIASTLSRNEHTLLIFVGQNHSSYGKQLRDTINDHNLEHRIKIIGRVEVEIYKKYLAAADIAVQLRGISRGENSASVLDCMNAGLPTISNANGSMAELPIDAVYLLPDIFTDQQLTEALENLFNDKNLCLKFGKKAKEIILSNHTPKDCAQLFAEAIEFFDKSSSTHSTILAQSIFKNRKSNSDFNNTDLIELAQSIAQTLPFEKVSNQLLLDISSTCKNGLKTGIERVVRALLMELLKMEIPGLRIEPVYLHYENNVWNYRYAHEYTFNLLKCPKPHALQDQIVEIANGDVLLTLDWSPREITESFLTGLHNRWKNLGVKIYSLVYDLLPIYLPEVFPPEADEQFKLWLMTINQFDGAVCISKEVANRLLEWRKKNESQFTKPYSITWTHQGADIESSVPSTGFPANANRTLQRISMRHTFLMVGTIEPRKNYLQTLNAFSLLWKHSIDVNLVIVGAEGWKSLPSQMRKTIPETISLLQSHPELNKRLFWLNGVSDEYLKKIYKTASCLIAASSDEGFGLPLIEAARYKLAIIARDIPIFREVAANHAYYFSGETPKSLAQAIKNWLNLYNENKHPNSINMPWLTWKQCAEKILSHLSL